MMPKVYLCRRAQWRHPTSLTSPTDEDAAEDVADNEADGAAADGQERPSADHDSVVASQVLQPTGSSHLAHGRCVDPRATWAIIAYASVVKVG